MPKNKMSLNRTKILAATSCGQGPPTTQKERESVCVCVCVLHDKMFSRVLPVSTHTLDRGSTAGFPVPPAIFLTLSGKAFPSVSSAGGPMTLRKSSTSHTEWTR